MNSPEKLTT